MKCRSITLGALAAIGWVAVQAGSAPPAAMHDIAIPAIPEQRAQDEPAVHDLIAAAFVAALRQRFDGRDVELRIDRLEQSPEGPQGEQVDASARFRLEGGGAWMPVRLEAFHDAATDALDVSSLAMGTASATAFRSQDAPGIPADPALDGAVERRLASEFPGQPIVLDLPRVRRVAGDARYVLVQGDGIARFGDAGGARVAVTAVFDTRAQAWIGIGYDLGQSV